MRLREGFSLLIAIFTIMLLSLVASYIFYANSIISKSGGLQYKREQAIIYARSYTEYAVMAIEANSRNANCIEDIKADIGNPDSAQGYRVEVKISYIGNSKYLSKCTNTIEKLNNTDPDTLDAVIDVYVKYKDIQHPDINNTNTPWQTYHKRSIQKI